MNEAAMLARSMREKRGGEGFAKEVMAKGGFGQQRKPLKECVETKAAVSQRLSTLSCSEEPTATQCCLNREQHNPADERSEIV